MDLWARRLAMLELAPLRDPSRQAAFEDRRVDEAERAQRPPQPRRRKQPQAVVNDRAHPVAETKIPHRGGKRDRVRQHMRQVGLGVGDRVDVEKHRAGNMAGKIFRAGVAPGRRHMPGGVEDDEIGRVEMVGEPLRRDE